ncbi:putative helicase-like protein (plasmid) [Streptomyces sp. Tu6071]|uniref:DEAD/DEAH box helicase n=1 Tax=Streptomyces sp. Tu6071 TaxID=355249 RepID=UPI00020E6BDF|nr:DEAD/DEAH box helicase [Streptomyces sp. Tu6071]EGJ72789.1 putative helicase-like protein [Streptomyces sp. Tu6071]
MACLPREEFQISVSRVPLRKHQVELMSDLRKWVRVAARESARSGRGARATVVSATGTGKTISAAVAALELFPSGRVLVMVPTLDLLVQTAQSWRAVGHTAPMVGVCSLPGDLLLEELRVRTTTHPIRLALWAGQGPVVVLATYSSLVGGDGQGGPLEAALAGSGLYGQRMDGFDLAVVDEAHRTAGSAAKPWAAIHDNARIPAAHRLYLTATPRVLAPARPDRDEDQEEGGGEAPALVTMANDPEGEYGAWIHELGLSEAIERKILAPFEIDVLEITDPEPELMEGMDREARRGRRLALLQTALLEHAAEHNLRTVMTFHQRVEEAAAFAEKMPETAAELYRNEVSAEDLALAEELPASEVGGGFYELEPGRHVRPERVWSRWLYGEHPVAERRAVLREFANGMDSAGVRVHRAFLASVRVLGEGVDIVGERGVEAICFADARGSQVEIVQNIGRALRPNPDGQTKTARIIVPVFLEADEDGEGMVASEAYRPLVAVLQGLRSHSEHLVEKLMLRARVRAESASARSAEEAGAGPARVLSDSGTSSPASQASGDVEGENEDDVEAGADGAEAGADGAEESESVLLRFSTPRSASTIAAFLRTRVYQPESTVWLEGYEALRAWRAEQGVRGLCAVPYDAEVAAGASRRYPVGRWTTAQRRARREGTLSAHRIDLLDAEGMVWEPREEEWERTLAGLRSYRAAYGHLAPRRRETWGEDEGEDVVRVGDLMANLRRKDGLGRDAERAAARAAQLRAVDADWDCPWPLDWQRCCRQLALLAADEPDGRAPRIARGVRIDGDDLGAWVARQQEPRVWAKLSTEQRARLEALGLRPTETAPRRGVEGTGAAGSGKRTAAARTAFQRGLAALAQWVEREGAEKPVPRKHTETVSVDGEDVDVRLGVWVSNVKSRFDGMGEDERGQLTALGVPWAV